MGFLSGVFGGPDKAEDIGLDDKLNEINSVLFNQEQRFGGLLEDRLKRSLDERNTVDDAQRDAEAARTLLTQVQDRNRSRVGDTRSAPALDAESARRARNSVVNVADAANTARIADEDFRTRTLQTLVDRGTQLQQQAVQTASSGAQAEQQRQSANARAAQQSGGFGQLLGAGVGFAFGGPGGAAAGAQIGGSLGI